MDNGCLYLIVGDAAVASSLRHFVLERWRKWLVKARVEKTGMFIELVLSGGTIDRKIECKWPFVASWSQNIIFWSDIDGIVKQFNVTNIDGSRVFGSEVICLDIGSASDGDRNVLHRDQFSIYQTNDSGDLVARAVNFPIRI